jgi:hypothetical protein
MIRNLKAMGLALVAVLALSAVAASSAWAGKLTSDGPVTLTGTLTGKENANVFIGFGGETTCSKATYTGHKYNVTPHVFIPSGESSITLTPNYGVCKYTNGPTTFIATVDMNGCDYALHLEEQVGLFEFKTKTTIVCPTGQHITMTLFTTAGEHTAGKSFCHFTITEKAAGYTGLIATDTANGKVDLTGTVEGISADKKSPGGSILCVEEMTANAKISLDMTFEGKNEKGVATPVELSF